MIIEHVMISDTAGRINVCRHEQISCLLPSVNNLFSPEKLEQERPSYRDKMNNVRFHCIGEGVAAVVCACDVIQSNSSMGSIGLPSTVQPQGFAS